MSQDGTLHCAECGVEMTTADAEMAISTDAGPVHRECFEGPVPPPALPDDFDFEGEEEQRRRHGDPPLPPHVTNEQAARYRHLLGDFPKPDPPMTDEEYAKAEGFDDDSEPHDCPECHAEASIRGGRGFLCRGRSML